MPSRRRKTPERRSSGAALALFALAAGAVATYAGMRGGAPRAHRQRFAPQRTAEHDPDRGWREHWLAGRTVTIDRSRAELYAFWRDFANLPKFMENVRSVEQLEGKRSRWTIAAPGTSEIVFESTLTEERPNELLAWQSDEDAEIHNSGRVTFKDAPAGRGTEVSVTIAYDPPGGAAGRMVAKLFQTEPEIQARRDLKRFKQLMETGEIAVSAPLPRL